jgi:hypothetical protein
MNSESSLIYLCLNHLVAHDAHLHIGLKELGQVLESTVRAATVTRLSEAEGRPQRVICCFLGKPKHFQNVSSIENSFAIIFAAEE